MIWKRIDWINVHTFSTDYDGIAANDILDIHKHLMKKNDIKYNVSRFRNLIQNQSMVYISKF